MNTQRTPRPRPYGTEPGYGWPAESTRGRRVKLTRKPRGASVSSRSHAQGTTPAHGRGSGGASPQAHLEEINEKRLREGIRARETRAQTKQPADENGPHKEPSCTTTRHIAEKHEKRRCGGSHAKSGEPPATSGSARRKNMNEKTNQNRSPWPACADCQIAADDTAAPVAVVQPAPKAEHSIDDDWNPFEVCKELEASSDEILRKAKEAYARAVARAHAAETTPHAPHEQSPQ